MTLVSPALVILAGEDVAADLPVEEDHLAVDGQRGAELGRADALLEQREKLMVALGDQVQGFAGLTARFLLARVALPAHRCPP